MLEWLKKLFTFAPGVQWFYLLYSKSSADFYVNIQGGAVKFQNYHISLDGVLQELDLLTLQTGCVIQDIHLIKRLLNCGSLHEYAISFSCSTQEWCLTTGNWKFTNRQYNRSLLHILTILEKMAEDVEKTETIREFSKI